ncbi:hypothetical protein LIX60_14845 [Streptomyces sp. S07_1.15]|uniref:hypothetical protein n=1 Tax=Streptomyces sp. S07_1.15 TaxID=2873925 RepID=UPI001D1453A5|nr:hypothetical protein [Streptomyces sp. S07_1.15]MCC3652716.1 hypothetical protein [Streptomyces sp. S07_1.15]
MRDVLTWATAHPLPAAGAALLLLAAVSALGWLAVRTVRRATARTPGAVVTAALAAAACTAYSADTSWRFAAHRLDMDSAMERAAMFAAAELALFATALMARQNLRTTGAPGTPGALVWLITGVQIIPAFAESGFVGGLVRAVVGPVLAALLWHLAMGIELRHHKPGEESGSLPAVLGRELRERLLSRLGLAVRDRSAEQISRDRATVKAVALAAKLADMGPKARGRARVAHRLSVAVGRAQAGADADQRRMLLELLAARRHAADLATIALPSPWETGRTQVDAEVTVERADGSGEPAEVDAEVNNEVTPGPRPELAPAPAEPLVICGGHTAFTPAVPPREVDTEVNNEVDTPAGRLSADEAMNRIRVAWTLGKPVTEAAELSTRSRSYVHKVYARLDEERHERWESDRSADAAWMEQLNADRSGAVMS